MIMFGWSIATIGVICLAGSVVLEVIHKEPIFLLTAKIGTGIMGIGGIIIGVTSLMQGV